MVQRLKKNKSNFRFSGVLYHQKMQFFVIKRSLNHVVDKLEENYPTWEKRHELICHIIRMYKVPLQP